MNSFYLLCIICVNMFNLLDTISSFRGPKIYIFKNRHFPNWIILITEHPIRHFVNFSSIFLVLDLPGIPTEQRLSMKILEKSAISYIKMRIYWWLEVNNTKIVTADMIKTNYYRYSLLQEGWSHPALWHCQQLTREHVKLYLSWK